MPPICSGIDVFEKIKLVCCKLTVPKESVSLYQIAYVWKDFWNIKSVIECIKNDKGVEAVERYDVNGRLLSEPTQGLNIVKLSNGKVKKEFVR